jgi:hypothetical protein
MDRQGLLALWRESLLAKAVLRGETTGYRHHPQLLRFQATGVPRSAINAYLYEIHAESAARGYRFDGSKVGPRRSMATIPVTSGQVQYEWAHLLTKLSARSRPLYLQWRGCAVPECHPLFHVIPGDVEIWERVGT